MPAAEQQRSSILSRGVVCHGRDALTTLFFILEDGTSTLVRIVAVDGVDMAGPEHKSIVRRNFVVVFKWLTLLGILWWPFR